MAALPLWMCIPRGKYPWAYLKYPAQIKNEFWQDPQERQFVDDSQKVRLMKCLRLSTEMIWQSVSTQLFFFFLRHSTVATELPAKDGNQHFSEQENNSELSVSFTKQEHNQILKHTKERGNKVLIRKQYKAVKPGLKLARHCSCKPGITTPEELKQKACKFEGCLGHIRTCLGNT